MDLVDRYTYRVFWSEEDQLFVGACSEFASLSHLDDSQGGALKGIRELVEQSIQILQEDNEPVPEPLSTHKYSGTFTVRVPPALHRQLVEQAAESNVSLNRFVSMKLAS